MNTELIQYNFEFQSRSISMFGRTDVSSDRDILHMIFISKMFDMKQFSQHNALLIYNEHMAALGSKPLLIDAGANIGAASKYFNEIYKNLKIVAIEPDAQNAAIAKLNLANCDDEIIQSALSSKNGHALLNTEDFGPISYRVGKSGNVQVPTVTIPKLIREIEGNAHPLIVKIDIEGGEEDVFENNVTWLEKIPCLIIELHDWMLPGKHNSKNLLKAISFFNFYVVYRCENLFCFNTDVLYPEC